METLYVKNRNCPFCGKKLIYQSTKCPNSIVLPCLECKSCKIYLYTEPYYNVLFQLAKNAHRDLNKKVYKYQYVTEEPKQIKNKQSKKHTKVKPKKNKTNDYKKNEPFDLHFQKRDTKLILQIKVPVNYLAFKLIKNSKYSFDFKSNFKNKKISLQIVLHNVNEKIKFILGGFNHNIYIDSKILYIILDDIPEITKNETPFNRMSDIIYIERNINNHLGSLKLKLWINKELAATSIMPLYINTTINTDKEKDKPKSKKSFIHKKNKQIQEEIQNPKNQFVKSSENFVKRDVGITAIVINDTRSCIYNEHLINDIVAILRIGTTAGDIKIYSVQAGYCNECDKYYILKKDFKLAQKLGAILCPVIDLTKIKDKKQYKIQSTTTESRIHQLGYNVIKKNMYTTKQRHLILANIIENTNISKHEIKSNIERCIKQHQTQPNYAEAVACWKIDYDFVSNYELGDIPQVKVEKIIIQ